MRTWPDPVLFSLTMMKVEYIAVDILDCKLPYSPGFIFNIFYYIYANILQQVISFIYIITSSEPQAQMAHYVFGKLKKLKKMQKKTRKKTDEKNATHQKQRKNCKKYGLNRVNKNRNSRITRGQAQFTYDSAESGRK